MAEKITVMYTEEQIDQTVRKLADQISKDYAGKRIRLVCVLKGASMFMCELAKRITVPVTFDFMCVSSYGGTTSTGMVKILKDLDQPIEGEHVLIVEDIIDTGRTLKSLKQLLEHRGAASVKIVTLLDKPSRRVENGIEVDYCGYKIPDAFVVGYGLDYDEEYRNLPYIGVLEFD